MLEAAWPYLASTITIVLSLIGSGHAVLRKRDVRGTIAWVGLIWLLPIVGVTLYALLGVNRIRRKARVLRPEAHEPMAELEPHSLGPSELDAPVRPLIRLVDRMVHHRLVAGNRIELLQNGDEAFPAMLAAIDAAERSVNLATYIFDGDRAGRQFCDALRRARDRGVEVKVLIDDVGKLYSWPPITRLLEQLDLPHALFLPTLVPGQLRFVNLRNHRKVLVVDGRVGFTGGMNVREGNCLAWSPKHPIRDIHARIEGPVVAHLQQVFAEDWHFTTGHQLAGERYFPQLAPAGRSVARGLPDGPDEDFEVLRMTLLGALSVARERVRVLTPYLVPDGALITALNVAAMSGVAVDLVIPARCNIRLVQWATMGLIWQLLERGCRVWQSPEPFDHGKLMVVDGRWTLLGSANWDMRTLRLNFEYNLECYDRELAAKAESIIVDRMTAGRELTLDEVEQRSLPAKLRDGAARLLTPYL
jgi:cardiolipin synthase